MLRQKLTQFEQNRKQAGPLPVGIAPQVFSPMYKTQCSARKQATSKDWSHYLSIEARHRGPSTLKASAGSKADVPVCNLGVARPVASTIPWKSLTMGLKDFGSGVSGSSFSSSESLLHDESSIACVDGEEAWDLGDALNYGHSAGSPQLLRFVTEHVELVHAPLYDDWATTLSVGNTNALDIILRMLCERGDWLLVEAHTYPGTLEMVKPLGIHLLGVEMDDEGLVPGTLERLLAEWDEDVRGRRRPFVLYMIPCGQNPTGSTQGPERRRQIYDVAERYDLIIIEDDPYFFIQLGDRGPVPPLSSPDDYLARLPRSYLSHDRSGRVLRLDTTSKILAAGLRAGWVTGSAQLINQFIYHTEFSTTAVGMPSQILMYKLLDQTWGHVGFIAWLQHLSARYRQSRDALIAACERWLPPHCSWNVPRYGMMVWLSVDVSPGIVASVTRNSIQVGESIHAFAVARGLQMSKGCWFAVEPDVPSRTVAFRLTFAAAPKESFDAGMKILRDVVLDSMKFS